MQHGEVCEVVTRQRFIAEMSVNAAESPQTSRTGPDPPPVREFDRAGIAHHHVGHGAATVDQDAHLPAGLMGDLGEGAGELLREEALGRKPAPK